jgi:hypothetical protein
LAFVEILALQEEVALVDTLHFTNFSSSDSLYNFDDALALDGFVVSIFGSDAASVDLAAAIQVVDVFDLVVQV